MITVHGREDEAQNDSQKNDRAVKGPDQIGRLITCISFTCPTRAQGFRRRDAEPVTFDTPRLMNNHAHEHHLTSCSRMLRERSQRKSETFLSPTNGSPALWTALNETVNRNGIGTCCASSWWEWMACRLKPLATWLHHCSLALLLQSPSRACFLCHSLHLHYFERAVQIPFACYLASNPARRSLHSLGPLNTFTR